MAEEKFGHASSAWETERSQLQSRLEAQEETNDKLQVLLRKLQEDLKASELRRNESVRQATAQMQTKLATAEDRYRQAVTQANKEEAKANEAQMQHREELQRLQVGATMHPARPRRARLRSFTSRGCGVCLCWGCV